MVILLVWIIWNIFFEFPTKILAWSSDQSFKIYLKWNFYWFPLWDIIFKMPISKKWRQEGSSIKSFIHSLDIFEPVRRDVIYVRTSPLVPAEVFIMLRGHSNNMWHFSWYFFDPPPPPCNIVPLFLSKSNCFKNIRHWTVNWIELNHMIKMVITLPKSELKNRIKSCDTLCDSAL